ncbi:hypothetical protein K435DRAFT_868604 [Dendrothele bispora CBS 962.96]|uniref:CxC2-like cysteine cluster KDZ transposase-associated domain-containing protein n=1 Tax=Dendrothele bispora (strain CBS 962.96) TaxID=1314807 RepID=A0A4S8LBR7_DENBC|nr:hypothetical protein K435DRAFT_868604 [Dendrothele bispora CBS 962.96]
MCKRGGRGHAVSGIKGTAPGELALDCPACPHPEKNLPPMWKDVEATLAVVSDEHHSPILGDRFAYLVPSSPYKEHIQQHENQEEMSSCSGFQAMFLANLRNVKGLHVSGIVGICCARHQVWRPTGLGDLQKGERYCNVYFVFWCTINGQEYLCIVISYDISCQWSRHFWERMANLNPSFQLQFTETGVKFLVSKFHLRGHKPECQHNFNFKLMPGCGETHGETVEEGWSLSNKAAAQTKEMGPCSRAQTLDDIFGWHNWLNIENLDNVIAKRLVNALKEYSIHDHDFEMFDKGLEQNMGRPVLEEWLEMVLTWEKDRFNQPCPYVDANSGSNKDQFKLTQLVMAEEETTALRTGSRMQYASSPCVFIASGIEIQEAHRNLELFRAGLIKRITHFRTLQQLLMPGLADVLSPQAMEQIEDPDFDHPEKIRLFLPSDCELPEYEACLRETEATDALEGLRDGLRARTAAAQFKLHNITGQVQSGRAGGVLRQIDIHIHSKKIRYCLACAALLRLRGHGEWEQKLQELRDEDVWGINERALNKEERAEWEEGRKRNEAFNNSEKGYLVEEGIASRVRGEGKRTLSWIWYDLTVSENDPEFQDALQIEWCKARARRLRWREEVMLLSEELVRMSRYFVWKSQWWEKRMVGQEGM